MYEEDLPWYTKLGRTLIRTGPYFKGRRRLEKLLARLVVPRNDREIIFRAADGFLVRSGILRRGGIADGVFWRGTMEPATTRFLRTWLQTGDVFYDVGANYGYFSLLAALSLKDDGSVVAFEPHPVALEALLANIDINDFTQAIVRPEALGATYGEATLTQPIHVSTGASTLCPVDDDRAHQRFRVKVRSLDEVIQELPLPPTTIKIDVEGSEAAVIKGAKRALSWAEPPLLVMEVNEVATHRGDTTVDVWLADLVEHGYHFLKLNDAAWPPKRWQPESQEKQLRSWFSSWFNVVAYHPDIHTQRLRQIADLS